jgi:hypothetical protein
MCLIIRKPPGRLLPAAFIEHAWVNNHDGWGGCVMGRGEPTATKGMQLDGLLAFNAALPSGCEAFIHLRKATHGAVNLAMAHPFEVMPGLQLMHNGTIAALAPDDPRSSDTAALAAELCNLLDGLAPTQARALLRSNGFNRLLGPLVEGSMVLLIDADGAVLLGRDWHVVQPGQWDASMVGIQVSNCHTWAAAAPAASAARPTGAAAHNTAAACAA